MNSVDRAIKRYATTLRQGKNPCRADGNPAGQMENYRNAIERVELRYSQIRELLMGKGVPTIHFSFYRSFGLYVDKLCRDHAGETLRLRTNDAVARWVNYGCAREVLADICREVFKLEVD
jgi:hypothetical protein